MHQTIKNLALVALATFMGASALASAPSERTTITVVRDASSGLRVQDTLSKNLFRQEARQVPYIIQEPYQATETYYVDVPYQETETYYVDVPYQERETYYERVPYTETEYYTDYEEYYDREYRCETRNRSEQICKDRESCHIVPGRGPDGGPRRECTRVPECRTETRPEQVCDYHNVRKTRPVQKTRLVTKYRDELRERTVTKYRSEARTRTVTKHRSEARTRTVTKYRDKEVCCKTEMFSVFDRQYSVPVSIIFPAGAELVGAERETFSVTLGGTEKAPTASLSLGSTVLGYAIKGQRQHGGGVEIELALKPLYSADQLGAATIQKLALLESNQGAVISFEDQGLRGRISTQYSYQITDIETREVLGAGVLTSVAAQVREVVPVGLQDHREYLLELRVVRQGQPLASPVDVVVSTTKKVTPLKNESLHLRRDLIKTFEVRGRGTDSRLLFIDQSPKDEGVQTTYRIEILLGGENSPVAGVQEILREHMPMTTKDFFNVPLLQLGVPASELSDKVRVGRSVTVRLTTTRQNPRLNGGVPVVLQHQFVQTVY